MNTDPISSMATVHEYVESLHHKIKLLESKLYKLDTCSHIVRTILANGDVQSAWLDELRE